MSQLSLFDVTDRLQALSEKGDPLEQLDRIVDWKVFRQLLKQVTPKKGRKGGRPPYDRIRLFKMLVLQSLFNLSDEQLEYQIKDRLSFMRFLGLTIADPVPDATTIWLFRETLIARGLDRKLFDHFNRFLTAQGFEARGGQIVDASIVQVPIRRGKADEDHPPRKRQQDQDAKWTKKHDKSYFGYKNHLNIDVRHKLIRNASVSDAAVHDSQQLDQVLDAENRGSRVFADSAYRSAETEEWLNGQGYQSRIHHRRYRNRDLTANQLRQNKNRSRIRARVEHVFGHQVTTMHATLIRTIGIKRARCKILLNNLTYNLCRYRFLMRGSGYA